MFNIHRFFDKYAQSKHPFSFTISYDELDYFNEWMYILDELHINYALTECYFDDKGKIYAYEIEVEPYESI